MKITDFFAIKEDVLVNIDQVTFNFYINRTWNGLIVDVGFLKESTKSFILDSIFHSPLGQNLAFPVSDDGIGKSWNCIHGLEDIFSFVNIAWKNCRCARFHHQVSGRIQMGFHVFIERPGLISPNGHPHGNQGNQRRHHQYKIDFFTDRKIFKKTNHRATVPVSYGYTDPTIKIGWVFHPLKGSVNPTAPLWFS